ncbi:hypothetical protein BSKO_09754 [Bryopsis sp. KO-2023]|nr:hypothetical protein BSKO_09754 [Bryopsis sp. KO-2023]
MPFKRYVQVGRLAVINYGPDYGQLVFISDVVDENRVLVDSPTFFSRKMINLTRLELTDYTIEITRLFSKKKLKEALESDDVIAKFTKSNWGKRMASQKAKSEMNDFERFQARMKKSATKRKIRAIVEKEQGS